MFGIREYFIAGIAVAVVGAVWYFLQGWHYTPLKNKDNIITARDEVIKYRDETIDTYAIEFNKVYAKLYTCENNSTVQTLNAYIDGIGDKNETINTDLYNLHS